MNDLALNQSLPTSRLKEFFLARQPILNREQDLVAYELLFRSAAAGPANVTDDVAATAAVIAHASELGMENVIGPALGFINVNATVLMSDFVQFLPKDKIVLEVLETVDVTDSVTARVEELVRAGYTVALDDVTVLSDNIQKLLPLAHIIKVDITGLEKGELLRLSGRFKAAGKRLLAEKVETLEEFQMCLDLGFDYFQGYYFARPLVMTGKKLSPSQLAIVHLMNQVLSHADTAEIEQTIKQDASLGLMLLRLVNTPAAGVAQRIDSIRQALMVLGRRQLQRWLQILLYAEPGRPPSTLSPLLALATTRGKLLELIAQRSNPGNRQIADIAFTIGIMSLMDALFGLPMDQILKKIAVADEVGDALLHRSGIYGDMLQLVECIEQLPKVCPRIHELLEKLSLSAEEFRDLQLAAFEWSDSISRSTNSAS